MLGLRMIPRSLLFSLAVLLGLASACQPEIGDSCGTSRDCSLTGDRQCDTAQPGGYCTILDCDPDTCPDGATCVEWRFIPSRTAETWCMKPCSDDGRCRGEYLCALPSTITADGQRAPEPLPEDERVARVIDLDAVRASGKVCAALVDMPTSETDVESDTFE